MKLTAKEASGKRCQEGFGPGPMSQGGCTHISSYGSAHGGFGPGPMSQGGCTHISSYGSAHGGFGAAYAVVTSPTNCIAGGCMAWRWSGHQTIDGEEIGFCGKVHIA